MKKMVMTKKEQIETLKEYTDAFLFGIQGLSVNTTNPISLEEVKKIVIEYPNKEFFISLNKNMHNEDLPLLRKTLKELNELPVCGILFYDVAVVRIKKEEKLSLPLIWAAEHLTTNFNTIQFFKEYKVCGTLLSSDITLREILEIRKNTEGTLIVPIFGYQSMMVSRRHLLKNYYKAFDINPSKEKMYIEKEGKKYPIFDTKEGTFVYSSDILNGNAEYETLEKAKIDYVLFDSTLIEEKIFLNIMKERKENNEQKIEKIIKENLPNVDNGFLYQETIYKVKK